ncbi:MAG: porin [Rhodoblastus sp.]|nr:porin [Rhodoblastus sp.]
MRLFKTALLGCAAALATATVGHAADLPTRKAAPVQYVKICDAYGAGFFYIPGTDTCLRVGGLVKSEIAISNTPYRINLPNLNIAGGVNNTTFAAIAAGGGFAPGIIPGVSRDAVGWGTEGRVELDARTQSPWGTVRSYIRVVSYFGAGATANTGALSNGILGLPGLGTQASRESTILDKGFIQFAGLTMGRVQSFFDFYANAVGYTGLRGSVQTVNALGYTARLGGGFSATLAIEDSVSHRAPGGNTIALTTPVVVGAPLSQYLGTRMPDIVANLRIDQPWGSAQLSGAIHRVGVGLFATGGIAIPGVVLPVNTVLAKDDRMGFAVQGGLKFNLGMLAKGDVLWLQATFARGAMGYVDGSNLSYNGGVYATTGYGVGGGRISSGNGWHGGSLESDCVWTYSGRCEVGTAFAIDAAFRHYWTPSLSSTLTADYYQVNYSANALNPAAGAAAWGSTNFGVGVTNYKEFLVATGLMWNPVKGFELGTEFTWQHGVTSRPVGLAPDAALIARGLPAFKSQNNLYRLRIRAARAF